MDLTLDDLLRLSPRDFEVVVTKLLEVEGFAEITHVGGSGDLGVDITARDPNGYAVAVQCKRFAPTNAVTSPMVQTFYGMIWQHRVMRGILVWQREESASK